MPQTVPPKYNALKPRLKMQVDDKRPPLPKHQSSIFIDFYKRKPKPLFYMKCLLLASVLLIDILLASALLILIVAQF